MRLKKTLSTLIVTLLVLCNIGCDQVSKTIVRGTIEYNEKIEVLDNYFILTKIENTGAFLSWGESLPAPIKFILLSLLPLTALSSGVYIVLTTTTISKPLVAGICFVIGGGIGNLYDRIVYGSVTDFLHLNFVIFQTGIFNMADVSIITGMFIILISSFPKKGKLKGLSN